jgi:hypothetical protein
LTVREQEEEERLLPIIHEMTADREKRQERFIERVARLAAKQHSRAVEVQALYEEYGWDAVDQWLYGERYTKWERLHLARQGQAGITELAQQERHQGKEKARRKRHNLQRLERLAAKEDPAARAPRA